MENTAVKSSLKKSALLRRKEASGGRASLDPDRWVDAAIEVLARNGIAGLRVEVLARRCGVTKGSFYWHFKDRQALLDAILARWKHGRIRDIEKSTACEPGQESAQLREAINRYGAAHNRKGMSIELAIREWARHDARAAQVVEEVDRYRLACSYKLFVGAGLPPAEARSRSLLLYACVFGLSMMHFTNFDGDLADLKQRIGERVLCA